MKKILIAVAFVTLCVSSVFADQVVLSNGDRLTGAIVKSDAKNLILKTEFAGEVTIKWDAVREITSGEPLHVQLKEGKDLVGKVTTTDGNLYVETNNGKVEAPKDAVVLLRSESEQAAYDKSLHPGLLQGWNGGQHRRLCLDTREQRDQEPCARIQCGAENAQRWNHVVYEFDLRDE